MHPLSDYMLAAAVALSGVKMMPDQCSLERWRAGENNPKPGNRAAVKAARKQARKNRKK